MTDFYTRSWQDVPKEACHFYHVIDLPNGETTPGQWDLRGRCEEYLGGIDFKGKRCLDIGCASGFLSFEMERMGAREVVSFDADDHRRITFLPVHSHKYMTDRHSWNREADQFLTMLKNGYWYSHKRLNSKAVALYGDVYELPAVEPFDVVVLAQILIHLRDPVTAIGEAARNCKDTLVIAEGVWDSKETAMISHARAVRGGPPYIWWQLSLPLYKEILAMCNFKIERVHSVPYKCSGHEYLNGDIPITTIVAKRCK